MARTSYTILQAYCNRGGPEDCSGRPTSLSRRTRRAYGVCNTPHDTAQEKPQAAMMRETPRRGRSLSTTTRLQKRGATGENDDDRKKRTANGVSA